MRIIFFALKITLLALVPMTVITSCDDDDPAPTTATIGGTITIENTDLWTTWQDSGELQLTLFPEFSLNPPAGWGDIPENALYPGFPGGRFALGAPVNAQNPIIINLQPNVTQYQYIMTVDPGTYSALALGFRHDFITDPTRRTATIGVYHNNPDVVSSGIVLKVDVGGGNFVTVINDPAPTPITVEAGDDLIINFKADLGFVEEWF